MRRHKDVNWILNNNASWNDVNAALLMDIRDELKRINARLNCPDTLAIPKILRRIAAHTKPRPRMFQGWRAKLQILLGRFNSFRGRHHKSLKTITRKLKRGLQKRPLR